MQIIKYKRWIFLILIVLAIYSTIIFIFVKNFPLIAHNLIEWFVSEAAEEYNGRVEMPNDYALYRVYPGKNIIVQESSEYIYKTYIGADIKEVGWNERYIIYKRITPNNALEIGLIDTKENEISHLSENEVDEKILELQGYGNIQIKKVESLFPKAR